MNIAKKTFLLNSLYTTFVNSITLLLSVLLTILLPKYISTSDFGLWQLFILYSSFVGFFHFGYNDGIYLKYGGRSLMKLPIKLLSTQFKLYVLLHCVVGLLMILFALYIEPLDKQYIIIACVIYMIIYNFCMLLNYTLLSTNRLKEYCNSNLLGRLFMLMGMILILLYSKAPNYKYFIVTYILSYLLTLIINLYYLKIIFSFKKNIGILKAFKMVLPLIKIGVVLMLSNITWHLVIGGGRLIVEHNWDIVQFAKVSLAISCSMFMFSFTSQISVVLFPVLRNSKNNTIISIISKSNIIFGIIIVCGLLLVLPLQLFVNYWLPKYQDSIIYFVYLMPMCFYLMKSELLYVTNFKNLNKQSLILKINMVCLLIALSFYLIFGNLLILEGIIISMLFVTILRNFVMQYYLNKNYKLSFIEKHDIMEFLIVIGFISIYKIYNANIGLILIYTLISIVLYFIFNRSDILKLKI